MKLITLVALIVFCWSASSFSSVDQSIIPVLNYSHDIESELRQVDNNYLVVVPEINRFPAGSQKQRFEQALNILEEVINSQEFKERVIGYTRANGKRSFQKNYLWRDRTELLTNDKIYSIIMEGDEKMIPSSLGEMNLNSYVKKCNWFMRYARKWCRGVIGSTSPYSSKWISMNWKFYRKYKTSEMVSNITHEWVHLLGFLHGRTNMREEVPYVIGAIASQITREILSRDGLAD